MITIEEIPIEKIDKFWKIHFEYLIRDEIISDDEDKVYSQSDEYRGLIKSHMIGELDKHHLIYFIHYGEKIGVAQFNTYHSEDGKCFIMDFWIFPQYRGNGMGHQCIRALEEYTKKDAALYYALNCDRECAQRFWHDIGFIDSEVEEYNIPLMISL